MADAIQAEGLRFSYPPYAAGAVTPWVLDGIDLDVLEGEWVAVMGASDAGKTTLCLCLAGLAPALTGGRLEGRVVVAGRDLARHPPPALADTIGVLFQEPESQLFNPTVEAEVAWGLENLGLPRPEIQAHLDRALEQMGLSDLRFRSPATLSGGEKKRLALASVLAMRPSVLILDEPMAGLDPAGREEVLAALAALRRDSAVTILMTESDPEAVAAFADRLVVLHAGRIALDGQPRALFGQPQRLASLGVAVPPMADLASRLNRRLGTRFDFFTPAEALAALGLSPVPASPPRAEAAATAPAKPAPRGIKPGVGALRAASAEPGLELEDVAFWYEEGRPVLKGVSLQVPRGQFVALLGANGSGKTTLAKHLNGLLRPCAGQVRVLGRPAEKRPVGELARQVSLLFQHPEQQIFCPTVAKEVAFGAQNLGLPRAEVAARTAAALARFGLDQVAGHPPAILGYGLRRRVTLASVAAMEAPCLVLDEPTEGLDAAGRAETQGWLAELHAQGRTILLITHDMALAADTADRTIVLHQGEVVFDGLPDRLFDRPHFLARASLAVPPAAALARALADRGLPAPRPTLDALSAACEALLVGTPPHSALDLRPPPPIGGDVQP